MLQVAGRPDQGLLKVERRLLAIEIGEERHQLRRNDQDGIGKLEGIADQ
jgi:hypothetical protein